MYTYNEVEHTSFFHLLEIVFFLEYDYPGMGTMMLYSFQPPPTIDALTFLESVWQNDE